MRETQSTSSRYKAFFAVFVVITILGVYILQQRQSPSDTWIKTLTLFHGTIVHTVSNRSAAFLNAFIQTESSSRAGNISAFDDVLLAPPEDKTVDKAGRYVSMCLGNFDNRRLGNQLFNFAAMLQAARLTDRRVAMVRRHPYGWLDRWFQVAITRVDSIDKELCPCAAVGEASPLAYSPHMADLPYRTDIANKSLLVCGFLQSWKYIVGVESAIRHHLRPLPNVSAAVNSYLDEIRPRDWRGLPYNRVGIHVRAGDVTRRDKYDFGYTIPQPSYFVQAMDRFTKQFGGRLQFIITTDSPRWVKKFIDFSSIAEHLNRTSNKSEIGVVYSEGHDAGFDLVLLSVCDGVIMSTGSYGWWGAWLANKTSIYYSNWPRPGSPLSGMINRNDFWPPNWIPIGGSMVPCCLSESEVENVRPYQ